MKEWAQEAKEEALDGEIEGMELFALMAEHGYGLYPSINVALRWYEEAAKKGSQMGKEKVIELRKKKEEIERQEREQEAKKS